MAAAGAADAGSCSRPEAAAAAAAGDAAPTERAPACVSRSSTSSLNVLS